AFLDLQRRRHRRELRRRVAGAAAMARRPRRRHVTGDDPSSREHRPMTQRRDFLRKASLLAAGTLAASPFAAPLGAETSDAIAQGSWDTSWTSRVTGRHKMCFDAHEISEGVCLHQARSFLQGYKDVYG